MDRGHGLQGYPVFSLSQCRFQIAVDKFRQPGFQPTDVCILTEKDIRIQIRILDIVRRWRRQRQKGAEMQMGVVGLVFCDACNLDGDAMLDGDGFIQCIFRMAEKFDSECPGQHDRIRR